MSMNVTEVEEALLALDRHERAAVIHRGLQTLEPGATNDSQTEVDAAWRDELRKRIEDIESGTVETVSLSESFAQARAAIGSLHQ